MARLGESRFAALGVALFAAALVVRSVPLLPAVVLGAFAVGVALPWPVIAAMTLVQRLTPGDLLGRVSAASGTLTFAPLAIAIPAGAGLLSAAGVWPVMVVAVGLLGYAVRSALRSPDHGYGADLGMGSAPQP